MLQLNCPGRQSIPSQPEIVSRARMPAFGAFDAVQLITPLHRVCPEGILQGLGTNEVIEPEGLADAGGGGGGGGAIVKLVCPETGVRGV